MDLADAVIAGQTATDGQVPKLRQGVVTQVSPLLVRVGAASTAQACNALASYRAVLGDAVSVLVVQGDRLVLGSAVAAAMAAGFYVTRTTNDSAVAGSGGGSDITWNNVVEQNWSTFSGFTTGSALTVPAGGAGLYVFSAGVYWLTGTTGVFCSITVNNLAKVGGIASAGGTVPMDRVYLSGTARLAVGDVVRLHIFNSSGVSITPNAFAGDIVSTPLPYLSAWRI